MERTTNGQGNNSTRDEWQTPIWLFDILDKQYNFKFDCCANFTNAKCPEYSNDFGSTVIRRKNGWMNPPFSIAKEMFESFFLNIVNGVAVYRSDNLETKLWQDLILPKADWIFMFDKRIKYDGQEGAGVRFPSALVGLNVPPPVGLNGTVLTLRKSPYRLLSEWRRRRAKI